MILFKNIESFGNLAKYEKFSVLVDGPTPVPTKQINFCDEECDEYDYDSLKECLDDPEHNNKEDIDWCKMCDKYDEFDYCDQNKKDDENEKDKNEKNKNEKDKNEKDKKEEDKKEEDKNEKNKNEKDKNEKDKNEKNNNEKDKNEKDKKEEDKNEKNKKEKAKKEKTKKDEERNKIIIRLVTIFIPIILIILYLFLTGNHLIAWGVIIQSVIFTIYGLVMNFVFNADSD